jgi:hypothetical protein
MFFDIDMMACWWYTLFADQPDTRSNGHSILGVAHSNHSAFAGHQLKTMPNSLSPVLSMTVFKDLVSGPSHQQSSIRFCSVFLRHLQTHTDIKLAGYLLHLIRPSKSSITTSLKTVLSTSLRLTSPRCPNKFTLTVPEMERSKQVVVQGTA